MTIQESGKLFGRRRKMGIDTFAGKGDKKTEENPHGISEKNDKLSPKVEEENLITIKVRKKYYYRCSRTTPLLCHTSLKWSWQDRQHWIYYPYSS
jgi:hypothetical protein